MRPAHRGMDRRLAPPYNHTNISYSVTARPFTEQDRTHSRCVRSMMKIASSPDEQTTMKNAVESVSSNGLKQTYQTTDLTLTSFLRCRGFQIENIKQNSGRTLFIFQESPELRQAILDFANDEAVNVRSFCSTMRDLKAITRVLIFFFAVIAGVNAVSAQTKTAPQKIER